MFRQYPPTSNVITSSTMTDTEASEGHINHRVPLLWGQRTSKCDIDSYRNLCARMTILVCISNELTLPKSIFVFFILCNAHSKKFRQLPFPIQYLVRSYWSRLKAIEQYLLWCGTWSNFPWLSLIFLEVFTNSSGSDFSTVGGIILFVWMGSMLRF